MSSLKLRAIPGALAAFAGLAIAAIALAPASSASAQVLSAQAAEVAYTAQLQSLEVSEVAVAEPVQRDTFSVEVHTVIGWPTTGPRAAEYSDGFGYRVPDTAGASSNHQGVDFTPGAGTPVLVIADGTVVSAGWSGSLGLAVTVSHVIDGRAVETVYGHMQDGSLGVYVGQDIPRGTQLGLVGSTGVSTGPHLHFEVHESGVPVDPYEWLLTHANAHLWS